MPESVANETREQLSEYDAYMALLQRSRAAAGDDEELYAAAFREIGELRLRGQCAAYWRLVQSGVRFRNRGNSVLAWLLGIAEQTEGPVVVDKPGKPPDIDLDFEGERRDEVIRYIVETYGGADGSHVGAIGTWGTFAARAALRFAAKTLTVAQAAGREPLGWSGADELLPTLVERVQQLPKARPADVEIPDDPAELADVVARAVPDHPPGISVEQALQDSPRLAGYCERLPVLFAIAIDLHGTIKYAGKHPAGLIVASQSLSDLVPPHVVQGERCSQYDMDDITELGLMKFDVLGLHVLQIMKGACRFAEEAGAEGVTEQLYDIERVVGDAEAMAVVAATETDGVFQLESPGMREAILDVQPTSIDDLNAIIALYRPGPKRYLSRRRFYADLAEEQRREPWIPGSTYAENKNGQCRVQYPHEALSDILAETYGIIVYQEQVSAIAMKLAGMTPTEADDLRAAVAKKHPEEMAILRPKFITQCVERGVPESVAEDIWGRIERFASYAFNKAHSTAYAIVAMQTAWLKAHYTVEFMSALLNAHLSDMDKLAKYEADCARWGIPILPVSINRSDLGYKPELWEDGIPAIRRGLGAQKGVSTAASAIVEVREEGGPYKDMDDLVQRCGRRGVPLNLTLLMALAESGALSELGIIPPRTEKERETLRERMRGLSKQGSAAARLYRRGVADVNF